MSSKKKQLVYLIKNLCCYKESPGNKKILGCETVSWARQGQLLIKMRNTGSEGTGEMSLQWVHVCESRYIYIYESPFAIPATVLQSGIVIHQHSEVCKTHTEK